MTTRRQVLAVGAWVVPALMIAKPAGASVSAEPGSTPPPSALPIPASHSPGQLAYTGDDLERDVEIGTALIAGGWMIHHWAAR